MTQQCINTCSDHSGMCANVNYLSKEMEEFKANFNIHKGEMKAKLDGSDKKYDDLRKELTDKMDAGFKKLEDKMDEKAKSSNDKRWILIGTICSPLVVIGCQKVLEHFIK